LGTELFTLKNNEVQVKPTTPHFCKTFSTGHNLHSDALRFRTKTHEVRFLKPVAALLLANPLNELLCVVTKQRRSEPLDSASLSELQHKRYRVSRSHTVFCVLLPRLILKVHRSCQPLCAHRAKEKNDYDVIRYSKGSSS